MNRFKLIVIAALAALPLSAFAASHHQKHMMNIHRGHMRNVRTHVHHRRMHMMNVHRGHMRNVRAHVHAMKAQPKM